MENNNPFDNTNTYDNSNMQNAIVPVYENNARRSLYIAVVAFLAGVLVGFGSYKIWPGISGEYAGIRQSDDEGSVFVIEENEDANMAIENEEESKESSGNAGASGKNVIIVNDQPAGNQVSVALVTLEEGGWVAVHEDRNGKLGNILGAQFFPAGTQSGAVDLLRAMEEGKMYYAILRGDDGDRQFDFTKDVPFDDTFVSFTAGATSI